MANAAKVSDLHLLDQSRLAEIYLVNVFGCDRIVRLLFFLREVIGDGFF